MRVCGDCTKCCEGSLKLEVRGHKVSRGSPCAFVNRGIGCGIYNDEDIRNNSPCSNFRCDWLTDESVPEEFKPSKSLFILETKEFYSPDLVNIGNEVPDCRYLRVVSTEAGGNPEVIEWAKNRSKNIVVNIGGVKEFLGSDTFIEAVTRDSTKSSSS